MRNRRFLPRQSWWYSSMTSWSSSFSAKASIAIMERMRLSPNLLVLGPSPLLDIFVLLLGAWGPSALTLDEGTWLRRETSPVYNRAWSHQRARVRLCGNQRKSMPIGRWEAQNGSGGSGVCVDNCDRSRMVRSSGLPPSGCSRTRLSALWRPEARGWLVSG